MGWIRSFLRVGSSTKEDQLPELSAHHLQSSTTLEFTQIIVISGCSPCQLFWITFWILLTNMEILWKWESWSQGRWVHSSFVQAWSHSEESAFPQMLGGDTPGSVAQPVWLFQSENFISFILLFRPALCLLLLSNRCTDSPGSYTFGRVFPVSSVGVKIVNKQYLSCLSSFISKLWSQLPPPCTEEEIVVVKGLEHKLNLASLRVGLGTEFINLQFWLRQVFSSLFPPPFPSSSWLVVLVWLSLHHASTVVSRTAE